MPLTATTTDRDHQVEGGRSARAVGELGVEEVDVTRAERAGDGEDPVLQWDVVARRPLEGREGHEGEQDRERKVDRARLGVVQNAELEQERQR
jgi:hypothetical protein